MLVPVELRRLAGARVVWLNKRWFLGRQIDVEDTGIERRVIRWLVAEFGYANPRADDPPGSFADRTRTLHADRYGSTSGMSPHGGSGRAVVSGCFQAKGIGVTPLVGVGAHAGHAHGCCSLEDGIREAIYSEVCAQEFPHGSIPMIAILDTGLTFSSPDATEIFDQGARRCIVIRPSTIRAAHAERAPFFKKSISGYVNSQSADVQRTRDVVRHWHEVSLNRLHDVPTIEDFVRRLAEQVAFGQVNRLFNGGYFSSNISISAALLDFGNMHALTDWSKATVLGNTPGFGEERQIIRRMIGSLVFYFRKYTDGDSNRPDEETLMRCYDRTHGKCFDRECLKMWNLEVLAGSRAGEAILAPVRRYFEQQQKQRIVYEFGKVKERCAAASAAAWLGNSAHSPKFPDSQEARTIEEVDRAIRRHFGHSPEGRRQTKGAWRSAQRYLRPRDSLDRGRLLADVHRTVRRWTGQPDSETIERLIADAIDAGRRHWPRLPSNFVVEGHVTRNGSSALICTRIPDGNRLIWIEGIRLGERFRCFGQTLLSNDVESMAFVAHRDNVWSFVLLLDPTLSGVARGFVVRVGARMLSVPPMTVEYLPGNPTEVMHRADAV